MERLDESKEGGGKAQILFDIFDQCPHYMAPHCPVMNGKPADLLFGRSENSFLLLSFSESVCNNGTHYGRAYSVRVTIQWCRGLVPEQTRLDPDSG